MTAETSRPPSAASPAPPRPARSSSRLAHGRSHSRSRRRRWSHAAIAALLLGVGLLMFAPIAWAFVTAVTPEDQAFSVPPTWVPSRLDFSSFSAVLEMIPFVQQVGNSLLVTGTIVVVSTVFSALAAYAFARVRFPGREAVFVVFLAGLMVPAQVTLIPTYILMRYLGLLDTHAALIVPALVQVFSIFMLRQHFQALPYEVEEAAQLDGAGRLRVLFRIYLPMSGPVLAALAIFVAERYWNDFMTPNLYLTTPSKMTIPVGLVSLQSQFGTTPAVVTFAGITLLVVPLLVLFLFTQRRLTEGLSIAGVSR